jgi:hypothetical protein
MRREWRLYFFANVFYEPAHFIFKGIESGEKCSNLFGMLRRKVEQPEVVPCKSKSLAKSEVGAEEKIGLIDQAQEDLAKFAKAFFCACVEISAEFIYGCNKASKVTA